MAIDRDELMALIRAEELARQVKFFYDDSDKMAIVNDSPPATIYWAPPGGWKCDCGGQQAGSHCVHILAAILAAARKQREIRGLAAGGGK